MVFFETMLLREHQLNDGFLGNQYIDLMTANAEEGLGRESCSTL